MNSVVVIFSRCSRNAECTDPSERAQAIVFVLLVMSNTTLGMGGLLTVWAEKGATTSSRAVVA